MILDDNSVVSTFPVVGVLREALGSQVVQLPSEFAGRKHADSSRSQCNDPIALVRPTSTEEVALAMRICHEHQQSVVTQGGLTGLAGGACLLGLDVALSLERMRGVESLDAVSGTLTVKAGTPLQEVQEAADAAGFFFPLDLGSRGSCTVGGNMATNAGGNRVIKYGMMRDQVLDVEAVTADGQVLGGLHQMIKNNTGYDLRNLLIGSEGTLAIMTRAVLRLRPKPSAVSTAFCGLPDYEAVTTLLARAQATLPAGVSAFEVMWPSYYDFYLGKLPELRQPLDDKHNFYVLLESTGTDPQRHNESFETFLGLMFEEGVVEDAALASSESDALAFWDIRDAVAENNRLLPGRVSFDVSFAISELEDAVNRCEARLRERWPLATIFIYGHLGDGNVHITVQEPDWPEGSPAEVQKIVYGVTGEMNGSVSAEHGIGTKRKSVLGLTRTPVELAYMKAIKAAFDPTGILNPGKVFDMPERIKLP